MEVRARSTSVRVSPRKIRLVAQPIRKMLAAKAVAMLMVTGKRAALPLVKTINSAVANATNNAKMQKDTLIIDSVQITEGPSLKRFHPSTRGRVHPYKKRSSNITVVLKEAYGTKS